MNRRTDTAEAAAVDFLVLPTGIPQSMRSLSPADAQACLDILAKDAGYRTQALERHTEAARVRLYLNAKAAGTEIPEDRLGALTSGEVFAAHGATDPSAPRDPYGL